MKNFISRGEKDHFVIKRLKEKVLSPQSIERMKQLGEGYLGKPYDLYFEWSDDRLYCSELVWKIYQKTLNIEIGNLKEMKDFDLNDPLVAKKLKERFGSKIPLNEKVISPVEMFDSPLLEEVSRN